jgi:hypothetical protein
MLNFLKIMNSFIKKIINKSFATTPDASFVMDKVAATTELKWSLSYLWGFGFGYLTSWALTILSDLNYLSLLILTMEVGKFLLMILVYYLYNKYIKSTLSNYYYKCSYRVFQTLNMLRSKVPYFNYYFFFNYYIFSCIVFCLYTYFAMKYVLDMVFCDNNDMLNTENPTVNENFQADKTNNNELDFKNKWSKWGAITITVIGCIISGYWLYKKITHLEIETSTVASPTTSEENVASPISESNLKNAPTVPSSLISPVSSPAIAVESPSDFKALQQMIDAIDAQSNNSGIKEHSNEVTSPVTSPVSSPAIAVESPNKKFSFQLFTVTNLKDENLQKQINSIKANPIVLKDDAPIMVAPNTERIPLDEELAAYRLKRLESIIYGDSIADVLFSKDKIYVAQKTMLQHGCSLGVFPKEELDRALIAVRFDAFHRKYTFTSPPEL